MDLGINLGFALKRWPEPERWATLVRDELGLGLVQFTLDLLDPWWPAGERQRLATRVRDAVADAGLTIHSAQLGLAWYTYNGLLHPNADGRAVAREWWRRAAATAAELGAPAVGGPLGALSAADAADPDTVARRYAELLDDVVAAADAAAAAGLSALLVEPTPLPREIPHTVDQARRLAEELHGRTAVPVRWVIDVGHALYRPLYGVDIALDDWLAPLRDDVGLLHLQNHDFRSDAHWGWPRVGAKDEVADIADGYDVAAFARTVRGAGLGNVPVVLEFFYPFELADEAVLANVVDSVRHCRTVLADEGGLSEGSPATDE